MATDHDGEPQLPDPNAYGAEVASQNGENAGEDVSVGSGIILDPPPGDPSKNPRMPSEGDVAGLLKGEGFSNPYSSLFEGSQQFAEWGPRGKRSWKVALAEVDIKLQDAALQSRSFPLRAGMMKGFTSQKAYRALFSQATPGITKIEVGILAGLSICIFGFVTLIALAYA